jgi:hypothetical protein
MTNGDRYLIEEVEKKSCAVEKVQDYLLIGPRRVSGITFIMYAQHRKIGKPNNLKFWEQ